MNEERRHVLEMLANGKINAAEAAKLLDALGVGGTAVPMPPRPAKLPPIPLLPPIPSIAKVARVHRVRTAHNYQRITPEYAAAIADAGLPDLQQDELWQLQIHHVTADYVRRLLKLDLPELTVDDIVQFAATAGSGGIERFEKLYIGRHDQRRVPIFAG